MIKIGRIWPFGKRSNDATPIALVGGRWWVDGEIVEDVVIIDQDKILSFGGNSATSAAQKVDLGGLLVTPGLVDACHPLAEDCLPALAPGPYNDRHRREEAITQLQSSGSAGEKALLGDGLMARALSCWRDGVTVVASPDVAENKSTPLRTPKTVWIQSLLWDKNPAKAFAKAGGRPVLVSAADGTSRAASREVDRLADGDMLAPNLLVVGGAGLTPADAKRLAAAGSWLVWRPVVDQFVLGQTAPPDVFATPGLKILVGAGSRRDGGRGLLAALQAADRYGYLPRERLLAAVTQAGREALQADAASVSRETSVDARLADLAFWDATSFEEAVFDKGRDSLQMVMVGGEVVLCREHLLGKLGRPERLKPVAGQENFFSVIENTECFT